MIRDIDGIIEGQIGIDLLFAVIQSCQRDFSSCVLSSQVDSAGKKTPRNRDIGAMFKSASSQTPKSKVVLEERSSDREPISINAATDCDLLYRSHAEKVTGSLLYPASLLCLLAMAVHS